MVCALIDGGRRVDYTAFGLPQAGTTGPAETTPAYAAGVHVQAAVAAGPARKVDLSCAVFDRPAGMRAAVFEPDLRAVETCRLGP